MHEPLIAQFQTAASAKRRKVMEKNLAKTRTKDSLRAFTKLTTIVDGEPRIISDPPLIVPVEELAERPRRSRGSRGPDPRYRRTLQGDRRQLLEGFRYVARGPQGRRGGQRRDACVDHADGRPGQRRSAVPADSKKPSPRCSSRSSARASTPNHGQRVVEGQRLMQAASDIMLGWHRVTGLDGIKRDFYFRQLWDKKGSAIIEAHEPATSSPPTADICGQTLARAHARSGDRDRDQRLPRQSDAIDQALADFAELVRRPERTRLRGAHHRCHDRTRQITDRPITRRTLIRG